MKYIFLDFDGVLNSYYYFQSNQYRKETKGLTDAHVMLTHIQYHLSPKLIKKLNNLVHESGAKVVVSSTWRLKYSNDELNEFLRLRGADFKIDDRTPRASLKRFSQSIARGDEIKDYIKALPELPEGIVIIDDIPNMCNLMQYLVLTNDSIGLSNKDIRDALDILNIKFVLPVDDDNDDYLEGFDDEKMDDY